MTTTTTTIEQLQAQLSAIAATLEQLQSATKASKPKASKPKASKPKASKPSTVKVQRYVNGKPTTDGYTNAYVDASIIEAVPGKPTVYLDERSNHPESAGWVWFTWRGTPSKATQDALAELLRTPGFNRSQKREKRTGNALCIFYKLD